MSRKLAPILFAVFVCVCFAGGYLSGSVVSSGNEPRTISNEQIAANVVLPDETMSDGLDSFVTPPSAEPTVAAADTIPEEDTLESDEQEAQQ